MTTARLGDVAEFINGFAFKPSDWGDEGFPIIRIQNLNDPMKPFNRTTRSVAKKYFVEPGELLVSWSASLGVFTWDRFEPGLVNQHIFKVVPDERVIIRGYLRHMLAGALVDMQRHLHGATMMHVNRAEFLGTQIPLPPLDEQHRISTILDLADALSAKRGRVLTALEGLVHNVFHDMFDEAGRKLVPLADLCVRITDGTHQSPEWSKDGHPFLFVSNITSGEIDFATSKFISDKTHAQLTGRCPIELGDVLYSTVGSYGVPVVVRTEKKFVFQRHIAHLKPRHDLVHPEFLAIQMASASVRRQADAAARGVAQKTVNLKDIKAFSVFAPPMGEQLDFVSKVEAVRAARLNGLRSRESLSALRSSLQSAAFSGAL